MLNLLDLERITTLVPTLFNIAMISEYELNCCSIIYQRLANEIMRFMEKRGSALAVFSTEPSVIVNTWPAYTFTKGRMYDVRGMEEIVAVPLEEPCREMPESWAMFYIGDHM